ncbi:MAG TPA: nuclear transport factor 2 family protein [Candidatus Limnocylindria bacterium]|jgi:hypothetical protein|nr:nuclear transport factor 2 family protein [Candidatus Limnocylindria bacterium]
MQNPVESCVERQIAAYNAQAVEACVACFAPDAVLERDLDGTRIAGQAALREFYTGLFRQHPANRCTILKRMIVAPHLVDEELIEGREGGPFRTVIIYRIEDGLIRHARSLGRENVN